jgi:hypothetical protein
MTLGIILAVALILAVYANELRLISREAEDE